MQKPFFPDVYFNGRKRKNKWKSQTVKYIFYFPIFLYNLCIFFWRRWNFLRRPRSLSLCVCLICYQVLSKECRRTFFTSVELSQLRDIKLFKNWNFYSKTRNIILWANFMLGYGDIMPKLFTNLVDQLWLIIL